MRLILISLTVLISSLGFIKPEETAAPELTKHYLEWQERNRTYWIHLPPAEKLQGAVPLLFHLHGGGGTGKGTPGLTYKQFNKIADREGFIVVYPDAIARNWNDGRTAHLKPQNRDVDDVGFIAAIIDEIKKEFEIDMDRIFTTGMSNGGFMSSRLLCDRADLFRGGAILTASLSEDYLPKCKPEKPVAVLVMNGTDDPLVPYDGGDVRLFKRGKSRGKIVSNDNYLDFWKERNNCTLQEEPIILPDNYERDYSTVSVTTYGDCSDGGALKFYKIVGGGHTWPGGKQYLGKRIIGYTNRDINACEEIWNFFNSLD
ncbi:MAG: prolyl oligopeptidase family serine peptidase [Bacteroidia bacterium]|nr:prolyl oligopeptidase family serine peptidase [Bacteroidia bacterium]